MIVVRKRLIFWILKAYIKKWGKSIAIFFLLGLVAFFLLRYLLNFISVKFPFVPRETIGLTGSYQITALPPLILNNISRGLTKTDASGVAKPDIASSWDITDNGKTYTFYLKPHVFFTDGTPVTSQTLPLSFADTKIEKPNASTLIIHLKDSYAPFLTTVSKPLVKKNFVGIGNYKVRDIKLNGDFVESITLVGVEFPYPIKVYQFYATTDALKIAFVLGNVTKVLGLSDISFKHTSFIHFPNVRIKKEVDTTQLVTLFYNTKDLSKKLRDALAYALPNTFLEGERAHSPFPSGYFVYEEDIMHVQKIDHAKELLQQTQNDTKSPLPVLTIQTLPEYEKTAQEVSRAWKNVGIKSTIKIVDTVPTTFQVFLGNFYLPKDPDQYTLWHSDQVNNITKYNNKRVDKLLEDGRKTTSMEKRMKIYADFQKYLLDDQPASFLYFPYAFSISRI